MPTNLEIFRKDFLNAKTYIQRKDGVPLRLLDNLSPDELKIAEEELIAAIDPGDSWPVMGLGHIKSVKALKKLYPLLNYSSRGTKVMIAYAIYQITQDPSMIDITIRETSPLNKWVDLIDIMYILPEFKNEKTDKLLHQFADHPEYLVAYNATRALGLPTEPVIERFRKKKM